MSNTSQTDTAAQAPGRIAVAFAALDPYVEINIPKPVERRWSGDMVRWGADNRYPWFLLDLYETSATLRTVIDGCVDFIAGDAVFFNGDMDAPLNRYGDTGRDIVRGCARDLKRTGGFALQVIRNNQGDIAEVYHLDMRFVRCNADADVFYYSEKWGRSNAKPETYPAFLPGLKDKWATLTPEERDRHASSIYYYREDRTHVYPTPCYIASIPAAVTERNIDDFHLNSLENGFMSSAIINFYNGIPTDQEKEDMERNVNEKLCGHQNAARIMLNFADSRQNGADIKEFKIEDFGERYKALEKTSKQKIFTAFRAIPALFGINPENTGFSETEYAEAFKLFNRTQIQPAQRSITDAFRRIYGEPVLTIRPFSLEGNIEDNVS